jgi:hypothetical protein
MFFGPPSALFGSPPAADNLWRGRRRGGGGGEGFYKSEEDEVKDQNN